MKLNRLIGHAGALADLLSVAPAVADLDCKQFIAAVKRLAKKVP